MATAMKILADATVVVHFGFILFVTAGGLAVLRYRRLAYIHVPAFLWGAAIEIWGWICPLTHLENYLRARAGGYETGFIEHYLLPIIYPELMFPGGVPRGFFISLGIIVLVVNAVIYWRVWKRWQGPI